MFRSLLRPMLAKLRGEGHSPVLSPADRVLGLQTAVIAPSVRLYVRRRFDGYGYIILGHQSYLGRNVELATTPGGTISVGRDTSIQDNCVLHGEISIGNHCLFGANIFVSSTVHRFRDQSHRLIRDQDRAFAHTEEKPSDFSRPITIEDDCYLGWGAVVMPGVTIGRGAIVGANCVVTRDIGPYEVHGGVPNKILSKRHHFSPPSSVSSSNELDIPYFYRGYGLAEGDLPTVPSEGIRVIQPRSVIILSGGAYRARVEGIVRVDTLTLGTRFNDGPVRLCTINRGRFQIELEGQPASDPTHTKIELIDVEYDNPHSLCEVAIRYAVIAAAVE